MVDKEKIMGEIRKTSKSRYEDLRKQCTTYGELACEVKKIKKKAIWERSRLEKLIADEMEDRLRREIEALPLQGSTS